MCGSKEKNFWFRPNQNSLAPAHCTHPACSVPGTWSYILLSQWITCYHNSFWGIGFPSKQEQVLKTTGPDMTWFAGYDLQCQTLPPGSPSHPGLSITPKASKTLYIATPTVASLKGPFGPRGIDRRARARARSRTTPGAHLKPQVQRHHGEGLRFLSGANDGANDGAI